MLGAGWQILGDTETGNRRFLVFVSAEVCQPAETEKLRFGISVSPKIRQPALGIRTLMPVRIMILMILMPMGIAGSSKVYLWRCFRK